MRRAHARLSVSREPLGEILARISRLPDLLDLHVFFQFIMNIISSRVTVRGNSMTDSIVSEEQF